MPQLLQGFLQPCGAVETVNPQRWQTGSGDAPDGAAGRGSVELIRAGEERIGEALDADGRFGTVTGEHAGRVRQ